MKKGLAIVLSLMLAAVLVSGLSAQKKVSVWCWDPNFNGASMKAAAAVYSKAHSDVTIEVVDIPQDIDAKIEAGLQAGGSGLPDIAMENLSNIKLIQYSRQEAKFLLETDPQLKKHPATRDALRKFSEKIHLE